jgi:chorismate mutase
MDTLSEVRAAIDRIDEQLIELLAERLKAVKRQPSSNRRRMRRW